MPKGDKLQLKADPEDGTTPVANLLLEAVAIANLSGKEKGAILYLWRRTYGWEDKATGKRLKKRNIPLAEWAVVLHNHPVHASEIITSLTKKNIFKRDFLGPGKGYIYQMNTNIASWNNSTVDLQLLQILVTLPEKGKSSKKQEVTLTENGKGSLPKNGNPPEANLGTLKESIKKVLKKDSSSADFLSADPLNEQRAKIFEELKARRGYNSPNAGAEAGAVTWMLKQGYSVENIMSAHDKLKKEMFWADKFLGMQSLKSQIGEVLKGEGYGGKQKWKPYKPPGESKPVKYIDAETGEIEEKG